MGCALMIVGVRIGRGVFWLRRRRGRGRRRSEVGEVELIWRFGAGGRFGRFGVYGVDWRYWASATGLSYWAQIARWISHSKNIDSFTEDTQEVLRPFIR